MPVKMSLALDSPKPSPRDKKLHIKKAALHTVKASNAKKINLKLKKTFARRSPSATTKREAPPMKEYLDKYTQAQNEASRRLLQQSISSKGSTKTRRDAENLPLVLIDSSRERLDETSIDKTKTIHETKPILKNKSPEETS